MADEATDGDCGWMTLRHAQVILQQIGKPTLMAVGARDMKVVGSDDSCRAGCRFTVNRSRLTQIVVRLAWNDTYTVEFVRTNARTGAQSVAESREGIYCDTLADAVYSLSCRGGA